MNPTGLHESFSQTTSIQNNGETDPLLTPRSPRSEDGESERSRSSSLTSRLSSKITPEASETPSRSPSLKSRLSTQTHPNSVTGSTREIYTQTEYLQPPPMPVEEMSREYKIETDLSNSLKKIIPSELFYLYEKCPEKRHLPNIREDVAVHNIISRDPNLTPIILLYFLAHVDDDRLPMYYDYDLAFEQAKIFNRQTERELKLDIQIGFAGVVGTCAAIPSLFPLLPIPLVSSAASAAIMTFTTTMVTAMAERRFNGTNPHRTSEVNDTRQEIKERIKEDFISCAVTLIRLNHGTKDQMAFAQKIATFCNIETIIKHYENAKMPNTKFILRPLYEALQYVKNGTYPESSLLLQQEIIICKQRKSIEKLSETIKSHEKEIVRFQAIFRPPSKRPASPTPTALAAPATPASS